jgi:hypothetical protein
MVFSLSLFPRFFHVYNTVPNIISNLIKILKPWMSDSRYLSTDVCYQPPFAG